MDVLLMINLSCLAGLVPALRRCALGAVALGVCTAGSWAQISPRVTWMRMLERDDANRNGRIEASEYSGSQRTFARFDHDESGALTEDELGVRLVPRPTSAAPTTRSAARAEAMQEDAMSSLKLRQAALLLLQVDERDDDVRTLTRDEFQRGWVAHDRNRDTSLTLAELIAEPGGVRRRLTGKAAEAFARLLFKAIDEDRNGLASAAEGLRWFDEYGAGVRNTALTIEAIDDDRSAIARGAYDELSTSSNPMPPISERLAFSGETEEPVTGTRPIRNEQPQRPTPRAASAATDRVAVAKEQTRERSDSPAQTTSTAQRGDRASTPEPAPRTERTPIGRSPVVATTRPTTRSRTGTTRDTESASTVTAREQSPRAADAVSGRRTASSTEAEGASSIDRVAAKPVATRTTTSTTRAPASEPKSSKKGKKDDNRQAEKSQSQKKASSKPTTKDAPRAEKTKPRAKEPELPGVQDKRTNDKGSKKKSSRDGKKGKAKSKR